MECFDEMMCIFNERRGFLGVVARIVAFPFDEIEQMLVMILEV